MIIINLTHPIFIAEEQIGISVHDANVMLERVYRNWLRPNDGITR